MDKLIYLNNIYDIYKDLLTNKQRVYFEEYYFNNLSYGEIGDKYGISRNAIYHQLKLIEKKLSLYEEKLKIFEKKEIINGIIDLIDNKEARKTIKDLF